VTEFADVATEYLVSKRLISCSETKNKSRSKTSQVWLGQEQSRSKEQQRRTRHKPSKRHPAIEREVKKTCFSDEPPSRKIDLVAAAPATGLVMVTMMRLIAPPPSLKSTSWKARIWIGEGGRWKAVAGLVLERGWRKSFTESKKDQNYYLIR